MEKNIEEFLIGKSAHTITLFEHLLSEYNLIGVVKLHSTKTMLVFSNQTDFAYIIQLGKDFIDLVITTSESIIKMILMTKLKNI